MGKILFGKPISVPTMLGAMTAFGRVAANSDATVGEARGAYDSLIRNVFSAAQSPDELLKELGSFPNREKGLPLFNSRAMEFGRSIVDQKLASLIWADSDTWKQHGLIRDNISLVAGLIDDAHKVNGVSERIARTYVEFSGRSGKDSLLVFGKPRSVPEMLTATIAFTRAIDDTDSELATIREAYDGVFNHVFASVEDPEGLIKELKSFPAEDLDGALLLAPAVKKLARKVMDQKLARLTWSGTKAYERHGITKVEADRTINLVKDAFEVDAVSEVAAQKFIDYTRRNIIEGDFDIVGNTRMMSRMGMFLYRASVIALTGGCMLMPPKITSYSDVLFSPGVAVYFTSIAVFGWTMFAELLMEKRAFKIKL